MAVSFRVQITKEIYSDKKKVLSLFTSAQKDKVMYHKLRYENGGYFVSLLDICCRHDISVTNFMPISLFLKYPKSFS